VPGATHSRPVVREALRFEALIGATIANVIDKGGRKDAVKF